MKQVSHIKHTNHPKISAARVKKTASRTGITLADWHLKAVYIGCLWVSISGLLWFLSHDILNAEPNDFQHWTLILHGAGSFIATMIFGSIAVQHLILGWKMQRNRISGITLFSVFAILILTAFLLYYGSEELHDYVRWVHIIIGLASFVVLPLHIYLGRRNRTKTASAH
ncbi:MAG TPA: hypothetical protein VGC12_00645 [Methyloradius sp.]